MSQYFIYYMEASIVCVIMFSIMLLHNVFNVDRQETMIRFDYVLVSFMSYFIVDAFWAATIAGVLPRTEIGVFLVNFGNFVLMTMITYSWLAYALAVEKYPKREDKKLWLLMSIPFAANTAALLISFFTAPEKLISDTLFPTPLYYAYQITVPIIYIVASLVYTLGKAVREKSYFKRKIHFHLGLMPMMVVIGGLVQVMVLPETPVFCFASAILMMYFYIESLEQRVSIDQLTGLSNRGQLHRYIMVDSNLYRENKHTFVVMIDINDFKRINDTYGHAEGDRALLMLADALKKIGSAALDPLFIARFGGDEFTLIAITEDEEELKSMIESIRRSVGDICRANNSPYIISISAGYSELAGGQDDFQNCLRRADQNMYEDKRISKGGYNAS